jgi:N-acetylmuramoyl-L-alanine amidase
MKRTIFLLFIFIFAATAFSFSENNRPTPPRATIRTLIIDPGHGGIDQGAKGKISTEAEVSLAVGLKFGEALAKEFPDLKIIYTRTEDIMAGNKKSPGEGNRYRATLANESGGDLFIAIHCNASGVIKHRELTGYKTSKVWVGKGKKRRQVTKKVPQYRYWTTPSPAEGTETYIWAVSKDDDKVDAINKNEEHYGEVDSTSTLEIPDPNDPVEKARMLIYAQHYFRKSLDLATLVEKEFVASGRISRGVKQRNNKGIWVLQATGMPSVLVELGFITDKDEEEYLNSEDGQKEIVEDMVAAFKTYKEKLESKSVSTGTSQ